MKISGFTFVRNAIVFGYPMLESLNSLLPLCDEIIVAAGESDDETISILKSLDNPKLKIFETVWDNNLRAGGQIYAEQTNIALSHCSGDWCIYLQADELFHEKDYDLILNDIKRVDKSSKVDAILFKYRHFYGSYDYVGVGRQWYRREIRAFRNTGNIISWGDAQGFRQKNGAKIEKLRAIQSEAEIYHYGWVRPPKAQYKKLQQTQSYYNEKPVKPLDDIADYDFDYDSAYELNKFDGKHPELMRDKIIKDNVWASHFQANKLKRKKFLHKVSDGIEKLSGYRIGEFKDFIEVKIKS